MKLLKNNFSIFNMMKNKIFQQAKNQRFFSMNKKGAIELSVNFLVISRLAIVIVGFSFYIFFTVFGEAQDLSDLTQEQLNERIEDLQCDGTVCMSSSYKKMNRGDLNLFGVKIQAVKKWYNGTSVRYSG